MSAKLIPATTWAAARMDPPPSGQILRRWCRAGKIPGAVRMGREWRVPANAEYCATAPAKDTKLMELIYGRGRKAA